MINGTGGNVGVRVTSEGVILIDDKFPRNSRRSKRTCTRSPTCR